jgi:hypothetical protein
MNSCKLYGTMICAILVLAASSAVAKDQNDQATYRLLTGNGEDSPPSSSQTMAEQSQCAGCCDLGCAQSCSSPRWTASADFIILDRIGSKSQELVQRVPLSTNVHDLSSTFGPVALDANDFQQGFAGGPKLGLIRRGDSGYDLELSYFQIDGWSNTKTIGPDDPPDWLVMRAPGSFLQTQDHTYQAMVWDYSSRLYNAELNVRWSPCDRVTMLTGFRWVNLSEDFQGSIMPADGRTAPFWDTTTRNNLYGFQIGGDWKMLDRGRFSIDGLVKAGIFDNNAEETAGVSIYRTVYWASTSTNHAAFLGEAALQCRYLVTERLALKAGYQAIWIEGVALAPGQIQETVSYGSAQPINVQALGVNCNGGVFYHGATAGLEFSF